MSLSSTRFVSGCAILFLVDILWTASSELTEHLYKRLNFNKPFFTAYVKSVLFTFYLFGFVFFDSWWSNSSRSSEYYSSIAENDQQNLTIDEDEDEEDNKVEEAAHGRINADKEEFEEINLNQPNLIVNPNMVGDVVESVEPTNSQRSEIKSPYIGEAVWLPISGCSDTSSLGGKSDEEDLDEDVHNDDDHLNATDDHKLLLISGSPVEESVLPAVPEVEIRQPSPIKKNVKRKRSVRFSKLMEVRHMTAKHAEDAFLSRLSYSAFMRHIYQKTHQAHQRSSRNSNSTSGPVFRTPSLNVKETALLAFYFTSIWFTANLSFHFGLQTSEAGLVNVLSSTTPLFTLLLGLIFPSGVPNDKISVTKVLAVGLFITSVAVISTTEPVGPPSPTLNSTLPVIFSPPSLPSNVTFPVGSLWTLCGAFFYAVYIVLMRYNVLHDSMLNFPMFFGFIGLFSLILMWPFILLLDFTQLETFQWPNNEQWGYLLVNGLCGTVISELLFLLGSFLTSSLVGTIAVSFTIPMAVFFDIFYKDITYPSSFFIGTIPMLLSFVVIILVSQNTDWDPIMAFVRRIKTFAEKLPPNNNAARYRNIADDTSMLQNLEASPESSTPVTPIDEEASPNGVVSNSNRRFGGYSKEEEDDDGEQTEALISDRDL